MKIFIERIQSYVAIDHQQPLRPPQLSDYLRDDMVERFSYMISKQTARNDVIVTNLCK
jgi:hypothetical protein